MSVPRKHHYLPKFFMARWGDAAGLVFEFRRPREALVVKHRHPAETGYIVDLYANEVAADPATRQALEMLFMQQVDDGAADALVWLETECRKPSDPRLRDAWSRFLMSLLHRSPARVKFLSAKLENYEAGSLNPDLASKYNALRGPEDPLQFEEWLAASGPIAPELKVRLLMRLIDNPRIGEALSGMIWDVIAFDSPRFGFLTGDQPIMMSNGVGTPNGFVLLAIGPNSLFIAANRREVIEAFRSQRPNAIETAINDACIRQSHHVVIAHHGQHRNFIDRRFLRETLDAGESGHVTWKSPLDP